MWVPSINAPNRFLPSFLWKASLYFHLLSVSVPAQVAPYPDCLLPGTKKIKRSWDSRDRDREIEIVREIVRERDREREREREK